MVGTALKTEGHIAIDTKIIGTGEVSSTGNASRSRSSTGDTILNGTISCTGIGHVVIGVETIDTVDATGGIGAVDAIGRANHTLTSGWRDGEL